MYNFLKEEHISDFIWNLLSDLIMRKVTHILYPWSVMWLWIGPMSSFCPLCAAICRSIECLTSAIISNKGSPVHCGDARKARCSVTNGLRDKPIPLVRFCSWQSNVHLVGIYPVKYLPPPWDFYPILILCFFTFTNIEYFWDNLDDTRVIFRQIIFVAQYTWIYESL